MWPKSETFVENTVNTSQTLNYFMSFFSLSGIKPSVQILLDLNHNCVSSTLTLAYFVIQTNGYLDSFQHRVKKRVEVLFL